MSEPPARVLFVAEPPAAWHVRRPAVVDCSVMAALLWGETAAAEAAQQLIDRALHAPTLLSYELANVARNKRRAGVPLEAALAGLEALADQRVVLHETEPQAMARLADRHGLTAYDAAYLLLAEKLQAPLLTFDRRLADAAARHLGGAA